MPDSDGCDQQHKAQLKAGHRGSVQLPILFSTLINGLYVGTECTLSKFTGVTKLGQAADTLDGCAAIQSDLHKLEK